MFSKLYQVNFVYFLGKQSYKTNLATISLALEKLKTSKMFIWIGDILLMYSHPLKQYLVNSWVLHKYLWGVG